MKTAALDSMFHPEWLGASDAPRQLAGGSVRVAAVRAEPGPQPLCWRSEAFAEDLSDLFPAEPATTPRRPLLRRALTALLRR